MTEHDLNHIWYLAESADSIRDNAVELQLWIWGLVGEVRRLRAGDLTAAEFQNLCHDLHLKNPPCTRAEFEDGCKMFQDRIFGKKGELP